MYTAHGLAGDLKKTMTKVSKEMENVEGVAASLGIDSQKYNDLQAQKGYVNYLQSQSKLALQPVEKLSKLERLIPHTSSHPVIRRLYNTRDQARAGLRDLKTTTETLSRDQLVQYAYASRTDLLKDLPWYKKNDVPEQMFWTLKFRCLHPSTEVKTWDILEFRPRYFLDWWDSEKTEDGESNVWNDMRVLARKFLDAKKSIDNLELKRSDLNQPLTDACMRTRDAILHLMYLINFSAQSKDRIQMLFEVTAPVVFIVCELIACAREMMTKSSVAVDPVFVVKLQKQLKVFLPLVHKVQVHLLSLGASVDFSTKMGSAGALEADIPTFSSDNLARRCELILKDIKLVNNMEEYKDFISDKRRRQQVDSAIGSDERVLQYITPPTPWPRTEVDVHFLESLGLTQVHVVNIETEIQIGQGSYGKVLKMKEARGSCMYAVKKLMDSGARARNRLEREAEIWAKLEHKYILPLIGFAILETSSLPALVSPLCVNNLWEFLFSQPGKTLNEKGRFQFLEDIVNGLTYLHDHHYAHGDLRAVNVLVREEASHMSYYAVLADFGVTDSMKDVGSHSINRTTKGQRTNDAWLAPELMITSTKGGKLARVSYKGDIWAFGCVVLEVQYGTSPFENSDPPCDKTLQDHCLPANREDIRGLRESHWALMCRCWEFDPEKRIDIVDLSIDVTRLLNELS